MFRKIYQVIFDARSLTHNIVSNAVARAIQAGFQFLVTPLYIKMLGPDSYGLVAFNATLLASFVFLDQLITPLLTRNFGILRTRDDSAGQMNNLLHTLSVVSIGIGFVVGIGIFIGSPFIATHWLKSDTLPIDTMTTALRLMGIIIAVQWPGFLYSGGFMALNRQSPLNMIRIGALILQTLATVSVLYMTHNIIIFFICQLVFSLAQVVLMNRVLWRQMPTLSSFKPKFSFDLLKDNKHYALGMLLIGLTTSILTQADKIIVSKFVSLAEFSAYSISFFLISAISMLILSPITATLQPHFAGLHVHKDKTKLGNEYHRWVQILSFLALVGFGPFLFYAEPLLKIWLGNSSPLVQPIAQLLPWVALGFILNTFVTMAYLAQVTSGWTRLAICKNVIVIAFYCPFVFIGVRYHGAILGAIAWVLLNLSYFLIEIPIMHRRIMKNEMWKFWWNDTSLPALVSISILYCSFLLMPTELTNKWGQFVYAGFANVISLCCLLAVLSAPRQKLLAWFTEFRSS